MVDRVVNDGVALLNTRWMDWCSIVVIVAITVTEVFLTIAPYFGFQPTGDSSSLAQQQTIIQNVFVSIVSFLVGASVGTRKKDDTIGTLSSTAAQAQAALAPLSDKTIPLAPNESVTVKADIATPDKE